LPKIVGAKINLLYPVFPEKAVKESMRLFATPNSGKIRF